mmetsp:Transcript_22559/g.62598  ORF Transcript_22559/g.62598 Transcript_22559/m.62598 type:complete len:450 (+) Transcript_22559:152-1501(+)
MALEHDASVPAVGFSESLRSELALCIQGSPEGAAPAFVAASFIASQACSGTHCLKDIVSASIELLQSRTLLRHQLASALTCEALSGRCAPRCLIALSAFSEAKLWTTDSLLQAEGGPQQLAAALPRLLDSDIAETNGCGKTRPLGLEVSDKRAAYHRVVGDIISGSLSGPGNASRAAAQSCLGLLRSSWSSWELQEECLVNLVDVLTTAAQHVRPSCVAHRFLLGELRALLCPEQRQFLASTVTWEWARPPPKLLTDAAQVVVKSAGPAPAAGVLKLSIRTGGPAWKVVFCTVTELVRHSEEGRRLVESMLQELTSQGATLGYEHVRGALMLARAAFSARCHTGERGALQSALAEYEQWFAQALACLSAASSGHRGAGAGSHKATQVLFRLLTELVPVDPFEILRAQRSACGGALARGGVVQDYVLLVQARMKELQLLQKAALNSSPPG